MEEFKVMSKSNVLYVYKSNKTESISSDKNDQGQEASVKYNAVLQKVHPKKFSIDNVDQVLFRTNFK